MPIRLSLAFLFLAATSEPAFAHLDPVAHGSFMAGFSHPLSGADHLLAMIAVGLLAAQAGGRGRFALPAAFVSVMVAGFVLALTGAPLPFVEPAILASVVGLGLLVALAVRTPAMAGAALAGIFALFHGHAHGAELGAADALSFGLGFIAATGLLHAAGLALGLSTGSRAAIVARFLGAMTAFGGAVFAFG